MKKTNNYLAVMAVFMLSQSIFAKTLDTASVRAEIAKVTYETVLPAHAKLVASRSKKNDFYILGDALPASAPVPVIASASAPAPASIPTAISATPVLNMKSPAVGPTYNIADYQTQVTATNLASNSNVAIIKAALHKADMNATKNAEPAQVAIASNGVNRAGINPLLKASAATASLSADNGIVVTKENIGKIKAAMSKNAVLGRANLVTHKAGVSVASAKQVSTVRAVASKKQRSAHRVAYAKQQASGHKIASKKQINSLKVASKKQRNHLSVASKKPVRHFNVASKKQVGVIKVASKSHHGVIKVANKKQISAPKLASKKQASKSAVAINRAVKQPKKSVANVAVNHYKTLTNDTDLIKA